MAENIATLGIKVTSSGVKETSENLEKVSKSSEKAQKAIDKLLESYKQQEIRAKGGKAGLAEYKLSVLGASEAEKKLASETIKATEKLNEANRAAKAHSDSINSLISKISALGAAYFGIQAIKGFASDLLETAKIADSYKYSLQAVSNSNEEAAETYEYLRKESDRLGLSLVSQEKAFTGFAAAAKQSGLKVEETRSIYTGLMEAMTAIHRTPEEASQALKAFQDMLSKGTIQAEELKKQLGNSLPGAMYYMADATGKTTQDLMKMMEKGILPAKEGVMILSDYLSNKFQIAAENASNSVQGSINKMEKAWYELKKAIVDAMGDNTTGIISNVTKKIKEFTDELSSPEAQKALKQFSDDIIVIADALVSATTATASFLRKVAELRNKELFDAGEFGNPIEVFLKGVEASKNGLIDFSTFFKASTSERIKILSEIKKKEDDYTASQVAAMKAVREGDNEKVKGIKRITDAQVEANKETFFGAAVSEEQAKQIQKIIDKIKEKASEAGKTSIQIQADQLRGLGMAEPLVQAQIKIMEATEAKNNAVRDGIKASKEAKSQEEKRVKFIEDYIANLEQEADTYKKGKEYTAEYVLGLKDATEAQKQRAMSAAAVIDAVKSEEYWENKRAKQLEEYGNLIEKITPNVEQSELKRQQAIELTAKIYDEKLNAALGNTIESFRILDEKQSKLSSIDEYFNNEELNNFKNSLKDVKEEINTFNGSSFGNEIADGINNAIISMRSLNDYLEKQSSIEEELNKKREEAQKLVGEDERKKALKEVNDLETKNIANQLLGYRQLFGTTSQLFKENSKERKALHNLEMAFAAAEIAMNLQKTISAAYLAIAESGTLPPPASFAAIAAMTALMAGIVSAAGGSLSGGGSGGGAASAAASTSSSTVLGSTEGSQSISNSLDFMTDIQSKQYNELRDINTGVESLNKNITGLVTSIVRTGGVSAYKGTLGTTNSTGSNAIKYGLSSVLILNDVFQSSMNNIDDTAKNLMSALSPLTLGATNLLSDAISGWTNSIVGSSKKVSLVAEGLKVSTGSIGDLLEDVGVSVEKFADIVITKKSGWLTGGGTKKYPKELVEALTPEEESIRILFTNVFKNMGETMVAIAKDLNLGEENIEAIYAYTFEVGKIDLKGLETAEEVNAALTKAINDAGDLAATKFFQEFVGKYQQIGEALLETAIRVASEKSVVEDILAMTNQSFSDANIPEIALATTQSIVDLAGGIKELQETSATYYSEFFTDAEKQTRLQNQLTETLGSFNLELPKTRKGYRDLVEAQKLNIESNQEAYVALLGASEVADKYYTAIENGDKVLAENQKNILAINSDIEKSIAQMDMTPLEKSIDDITRSTAATIQKLIDLGATEDQLTLARLYGERQINATIEAERKNTEAQEKANQKLYDNKYVELLEAQGNATQALNLQRALEVKELSESLIPIQQQIYALQDKRKLDEMQVQILELEGKHIESVILQRKLEFESLTDSEKVLQERIYQLEDEKKALEKANAERKTLLEQQLSDAEEALKRSIDNQISIYQKLADDANKILEEAKSLLDRSFEAEKEKITKRHEDLIANLTDRLEEAQQAASDLESLFNSLSDARKSLESQSGGITYVSVQKQLIDALESARQGDLTKSKELVPNLNVLTSQTPESYRSEQDFKRDFFKTYNAMSELEKISGTQLTEQQQIIKNLETQIQQENINYQATMDALQAQYDAVIGVNNSVVSFEQAVMQYQQAQYAADGANTLLKSQTEILNNQLNALLGIDTGILSVEAAINNLVAAQAAMAAFNAAQPVTVPAFASGGIHYGGLRIVGENGPEMEYTPPANITSNKDLKEMLDNTDVVRVLREVKESIDRGNFAVAKNTGETAKVLKKFDYDGMPEQRTA